MDFNKRCRQLLAGINRQTPAKLIQLRIESPESLFDPFGPSPPDNKNITAQLELYLTEAVKAIKRAVTVKARVAFRKKAASPTKCALQSRAVFAERPKRRSPDIFLLYGWRESAQDVTAYVRLSLAEIEFAVQGFYEHA